MTITAVLGQVQCIRKDDCIGLNVNLAEVGLADHPNKINKNTKINVNGAYIIPNLADAKIYNVSIEQKNFCWANPVQKIKITEESS